MRRIILPIGVALLGFWACKKKAQDKSVPEILSGQAWRVSQNYVNGVADTAACEMDDKHEFLADSVYLLDPGMSLCSSGETAKEYAWYIANNNTILVLVTPAYTYHYQINIVTADRLDIQTTISGNIFRKVFVWY